MTTAPQNVLEVRDLRVSFFVDGRELKAVDGASFQLQRGRVLALVGESGCGKSVTAYSVLRLIQKPGRVVGGNILLNLKGRAAVDTAKLTADAPELYELRGGSVGMVFQEPMTALSPVHTVGNQLSEAISLHQRLEPRAIEERARAILEEVGLSSSADVLKRHPHELSGGMRQRVMIAIALANQPELVIADEPTTALDVTLQAQVLGLLKRLQREHSLSVLLITHDLGVVAQTADDIAIMYLGRIVEAGPMRQVLKHPRHPYTRGLLDSIPSRVPLGKRLPSIEGTVPQLTAIPAGCAFHPRCPHALPGRCDQGDPPTLESLGGQQQAACFRLAELG
jgi:oligopeptide/dipeptide ABC transporter ATP-binding protein